MITSHRHVYVCCVVIPVQLTMESLVTRLDGLASPLVEQITKYVGVTEQQAKVLYFMSLNMFH